MTTKIEEIGERQESRGQTFITMLEVAISQLTEKLSDAKGSYADLCRLIELKRELDAAQDNEAIREIKVTWIEPKATESGSEK